MLVTGPNGAGKTNLLESVHVATQGFSFRTRQDAQLVRRGAAEGSCASRATAGAPRRAGRPALDERAQADPAQRGGRRLGRGAAGQDPRPGLHARPAGGGQGRPRRAPRLLRPRPRARLPARADLPTAYASAVGQRNAALRRVGAGLSGTDALAPVDRAGGDARRDARRGPPPRARAARSRVRGARGELGLDAAALAYDADPPTRDDLEARLARDLERGTTGLGPHLDEIRLLAGERDLRTYGSQGEQRLAVLSLLLAEAELLTDQVGIPPLLLLDDALSELDADRRRCSARGSERSARRSSPRRAPRRCRWRPRSSSP